MLVFYTQILQKQLYW